MRSKKEIRKKMAEVEEYTNYSGAPNPVDVKIGWYEALEWVLGGGGG